MDCIVCEEHSLIPRKAIRSEIVELTDFNGLREKFFDERFNVLTAN
jgi:hypothetical protein